MKPALGNVVLAAAVFASALVVVQTKHQNRRLVGELERLRQEQAVLEMEWTQLQLEEATLAQHGRIERLARERLAMVTPPAFVTVGMPRAATRAAAATTPSGATPTVPSVAAARPDPAAAPSNGASGPANAPNPARPDRDLP